MVSGGTRFTRSEKPRRPPRVIDVEARARHETLYDVLVVAPHTSTRQIRKVARALRRNLPDTSALHDVCLAEQVLGRAELRAEYDALLGRLAAAKQPMPRIGTAIEGARLGPALSTRVGDASRAGLAVTGKVVGVLLRVTFVIVLVVLMAVALAPTKTTKYDFEKIKIPEFKPIHIEIPKFEYHPIEIPKFESRPIDIVEPPPPSPVAPKPRSR